MNGFPPRRSINYHAAMVTLREHIETRLEAMDKALDLARELMEARMAGFPAQFVQKGDTDVALAQLAADLKVLNEAKSRMEGKASQNSMILAVSLSAVSFFLAVIGFLLRFLKV